MSCGLILGFTDRLFFDGPRRGNPRVRGYEFVCLTQKSWPIDLTQAETCLMICNCEYSDIEE